MRKDKGPAMVIPLSPRSTNIQSKPRDLQKKVVEREAVKLSKQKDHAPPPPPVVIQPPEAHEGPTVEYQTGRELGKGGFAICYEGRPRRATGGQTYALKIVKASMAQKNNRQKFRTELQIHAKMRHPNIVEFHKAFTYEECTYVVLELCPNGSIQDIVRARLGLSLPEIRRLVVQLCGAIKYMHARNVIHRDLKMGNLFLDHEMNVKIGDFGLAAVLVSPGEYEGSYTKALSRRTTLCGTPNYIAPEILDKTKGGHDLKVDIWALGCIIYAMICCRPPFQAESNNEIYEKAKAVDYHWPERGSDPKFRIHIPEEAKDLVAGLLQPNPKDRLNLDETVSHPFFSMNGGDCIPAVIDPSCKKKDPSWLSSAEPKGDVMLADTPRLQLRDLAKACGVGHFDDPKESFQVVGGDVDVSLYKACLAEEVADTCPRVPLPVGTVYTGKISAKARSSIKDSAAPPVPRLPHTMRGKPLRELGTLPEDDGVAIIKGSSARNVAAHISKVGDRASGPKSSAHDPLAPVDNTSERSSKSDSKTAMESASSRVSSRMMNERPVRMTKTLPRNTSRVTRSQKAGLTREDAIYVDEEMPKPSPRLTKDQIIDQLSPNPDEKRRELALRGKARIAANLQNELNALTSENRKASRGTLPVRTKPASKTDTKNESERSGWLLSPQDKPESLPKTASKDVNGILRLHQEALDLALWTVSEAMHAEFDIDPSSSSDFCKTRDPPPLITKWVDYTNKLGVGYTLADGSIGCIIKANDVYDNPLCGVHVAHTRGHYLKRNTDPCYSQALQLVPQSGYPIEFTEMSEKEGIRRITVPADRFKIGVDSQDGVAKMEPTRDIHETEKRRRLSYWSRFADYMLKNLAPDASMDSDALSHSKHTPGPFLRFFQRLGNVSLWLFVDGAFQFNFPDHTKMTLHRNGKWLDFYCLPVPVIRRLKASRGLNQQMLDTRKKFSYSVETFLRLCAIDHEDAVKKDLKVVLQENDVESKIKFVRDVFAVWNREGGIGRLGKDKHMKWYGFSEKKSLAWVSVGASGGDIYYKLNEEKEKR
ncbi:MAG: hypothetical protein Q9209_000778 [Squamulea sp. 1 TL-2023]